MINIVKWNKSKKGNLEDPFWIIAVLFALAISIIVIYYAWTRVEPELSSAISGAIPGGDATFNVTSTLQGGTSVLESFNWLFPVLLLGLIITTMISAFFIQSHPAFFFASLLVLMILLTFAPIMSNVYQAIIESDEMAADAGKFDVMNFMMQKMPWIIFIVFIVIVIMLFAKPGSASQPI